MSNTKSKPVIVDGVDVVEAAQAEIARRVNNAGKKKKQKTPAVVVELGKASGAELQAYVAGEAKPSKLTLVSPAKEKTEPSEEQKAAAAEAFRLAYAKADKGAKQRAGRRAMGLVYREGLSPEKAASQGVKKAHAEKKALAGV